jgi:antagonist of KipI
VELIKSANIKSEGIIRGSIQVPADGQPILLLSDHQTIGGYPKIGVVITADYNNLIQILPGNLIAFRKVNMREAEISFQLKQASLKAMIESIIKIN